MDVDTATTPVTQSQVTQVVVEVKGLNFIKLFHNNDRSITFPPNTDDKDLDEITWGLDKIFVKYQSILVDTVPLSWFTWFRSNTKSTHFFNLVLKARRDKNGLFSYDTMPRLKIHWSKLYGYAVHTNYEDAKHGRLFVNMLLDWFNTIIAGNMKQRKDMIKFKTKLEMLCVADDRDKWIFTGLDSRALLDIKNISIPLLTPSQILSNGGSKAMSGNYTVALSTGVFPVPCFVSPLYHLIIGGQHDILYPSSLKHLTELYQFYYISKNYGQDLALHDGAQFLMKLEEERHKIEDWYKKSFEFLIKKFQTTIFNPSGTLKTIDEIKADLAKPHTLKTIRIFVQTFCEIQHDYIRRLANWIEVVTYDSFFSASSWTGNEVSMFPNLAKHIPLSWPNFDSYHDSSPLDTTSEMMVENEKEYLGKLAGTDTNIWNLLLTPNLYYSIRPKSNNTSQIKLEIVKKKDGFGNGEDDIIQASECRSSIINLLLQTSLDTKNKSSKDVTLLYNFRTKFVDACHDHQIQCVHNLLDLLLTVTSEKTRPLEEGLLPSEGGSLLKPSGKYIGLILDQFVDLYKDKDFQEEEFKTPFGEIQSLDPNDAITNCWGGLDDKAPSKNGIQSSHFTKIQDYVLPVCAIIHTQAMYLLNHVL